MIVTSADPGIDFATSYARGGEYHGSDFRGLHGFRSDVCVIEYPQWRKGGAPPNSLIRLAFSAGALATRINAPTTVEVYPVTWKGSLPQSILEGHILAALTPVERGRLELSLLSVKKEKQHNVFDSIGILLWYLKRLRIR